MQATTTAMIAAMLISAGAAHADWPTDPGSPLFVGPINNGFDERAGIRSGVDGSVWLAWQEAFCQGDLLLQHVSIDGDLLAPMGLVIQDDPTCGFHLEPLMSVIGDSIVVTRNQSSLLDTPVQRFSDDGSTLWGTGFVDDESLVMGAMLAMSNGDALIASLGFGTIHIDRLDGAGNPVWAEQLVFDSPTGANFDLVELVPDGQGGAYLFWDSPATYVRLMFAMRITPDGQTAWAEPVRVVDATSPSSGGVSRHTHSEVTIDGQGGAIAVYSEGFEQGTSPAAMYMQRVLPDGSLAFPMPGVAVSTDFDRQFDVDLERDTVSNDLLITWRHGFFESVDVRAQRMSIEGERLWENEGIEIRPISLNTSSFDSVWVDNALKTAIGVPIEVAMIQTSADGVVDPIQIIVGNSGPASFVNAAASGEGVIISWQVNGPEFNDLLVAQRVNRLGELGGPPICAADLTGDQSLDFFDVSAFLGAFTSQDPIADFNDDSLFNFFDVSAFLNAFSAGCP